MSGSRVPPVALNLVLSWLGSCLCPQQLGQALIRYMLERNQNRFVHLTACAPVVPGGLYKVLLSGVVCHLCFGL